MVIRRSVISELQIECRLANFKDRFIAKHLFTTFKQRKSNNKKINPHHFVHAMYNNYFPIENQEENKTHEMNSFFFRNTEEEIDCSFQQENHKEKGDVNMQEKNDREKVPNTFQQNGLMNQINDRNDNSLFQANPFGSYCNEQGSNFLNQKVELNQQIYFAEITPPFFRSSLQNTYQNQTNFPIEFLDIRNQRNRKEHEFSNFGILELNNQRDQASRKKQKKRQEVYFQERYVAEKQWKENLIYTQTKQDIEIESHQNQYCFRESQNFSNYQISEHNRSKRRKIMICNNTVSKFTKLFTKKSNSKKSKQKSKSKIKKSKSKREKDKTGQSFQLSKQQKVNWVDILPSEIILFEILQFLTGEELWSTIYYVNKELYSYVKKEEFWSYKCELISKMKYKEVKFQKQIVYDRELHKIENEKKRFGNRKLIRKQLTIKTSPNKEPLRSKRLKSLQSSPLPNSSEKINWERKRSNIYGINIRLLKKIEHPNERKNKFVFKKYKRINRNEIVSWDWKNLYKRFFLPIQFEMKKSSPDIYFSASPANSQNFPSKERTVLKRGKNWKKGSNKNLHENRQRAVKLTNHDVKKRNVVLDYVINMEGKYKFNFLVYSSNERFVGICIGCVDSRKYETIHDNRNCSFIGKSKASWAIGLYNEWPDGIHMLNNDKGDVYFQGKFKNGDLITLEVVFKKNKKADISFSVNHDNKGICYADVDSSFLSPAVSFSTDKSILQVIDIVDENDAQLFNEKKRNEWAKEIKKKFQM